MADISGLGTSIRILASNTFPVGIEITQFADDSDPLDVPELDIAAVATGLNGDLVSFSSANPIEMTLNVIPNTPDDSNLQVLFEANRPGRNKVASKDIITVVVSYPGSGQTSLLKGVCLAFVPVLSIASEGRLKTRPYKFAFENRVAL